jgi:hypothetical protein
VDGPDILVPSLSIPSIDDKFGNRWQYHSRSDKHSKIACWGVTYDLLKASATLRQHVTEGKVVFGINHQMRDFATGRQKDLDLVISRPAAPVTPGGRRFTDLIEKWDVVLSKDQAAGLTSMPDPIEGAVGAVLVALEAKACMTAHVKSLPRLYDELNSSHLTVHGASESALAIGLVMVNLSQEFLSPGLNTFDMARQVAEVSTNPQPRSTERVLQKIGEMPRRTRTGQNGFDGLGVVVVEARNDGSPVLLEKSPPAPQPGTLFHYDSMITRMANEYDVAFRHI